MFLKKGKKKKKKERGVREKETREAPEAARLGRGMAGRGPAPPWVLTPSHPGRGAQGKRVSWGPVRVESLQRGSCPLD